MIKEVYSTYKIFVVPCCLIFLNNKTKEKVA